MPPIPTLDNLPKVELHLHLDCSLSYAVVAQLAPETSFEAYQELFVGPARCTNLAHYLTFPARQIALMQSVTALRAVVWDLFEQLRNDHVLYAEIRFAPLLHLAGALTPAEVVATVDQAVAEAVQATGVEARVLLCTLRHFSAEQSMQTVELVQQFRHSYVAGFDIAGDEAGFPLAPHVAAFKWAANHAIPCTAHAGEALGAPSVWETLDQLSPRRIGHGVRSIEDATLVATLARQKIHLEVCPSCNVQIGVVPSFAEHPVDALYRAQVPLNLNTDTRTVSNVTLRQEYARMTATFGWTSADFLRCNQAALQAAFIPETMRQVLLKRLLKEHCAIFQG